VNDESLIESPLLAERNTETGGPCTLTLDERVDKVYDDIGGCGRFQVFVYFALAFGMSAPSWFIYEIGYLDQKPSDYICTYKSPL